MTWKPGVEPLPSTASIRAHLIAFHGEDEAYASFHTAGLLLSDHRNYHRQLRCHHDHPEAT